MRKLWNDECGAVVSAELVMVMTILGLGMIVGLKAVQASINAEMGDVAGAIGATNQGYDLPGTATCTGETGLDGSAYDDAPDGCQDANMAGIDISTVADVGE